MSYGHESGYEAVYLELQQQNNRAIERMADAIESMTTALVEIGARSETTTEAIDLFVKQWKSPPPATWPIYDN